MTTKTKRVKIPEDAIAPSNVIGFLNVKKTATTRFFLAEGVFDICIQPNKMVDSTASFSKATLYIGN